MMEICSVTCMSNIIYFGVSFVTHVVVSNVIHVTASKVIHIVVFQVVSCFVHMVVAVSYCGVLSWCLVVSYKTCCDFCSTKLTSVDFRDNVNILMLIRIHNCNQILNHKTSKYNTNNLKQGKKQQQSSSGYLQTEPTTVKKT